MKQELIEKLNNKTALIGIVGLGYVGIPLSISYADNGYKVVGFDIDHSKIDHLSQGETYIKHIPDSAIQGLVDTGFEATVAFSMMMSSRGTSWCIP